MKHLIFLILLLSTSSSACIIGPQIVLAESIDGFEINTKESKLCDSCLMIYAKAPEQYKSNPFSHGVFTVIMDGSLISKTLHSSKNDTGIPEFMGVIGRKGGVEYELTFEYGRGRCMSYLLTHKSARNGS